MYEASSRSWNAFEVQDHLSEDTYEDVTVTSALECFAHVWQDLPGHTFNDAQILKGANELLVILSVVLRGSLSYTCQEGRKQNPLHVLWGTCHQGCDRF